MKYIILVGDGMAGLPLKELDGKTTLAHAKTPNMDYMARHGRLGLAHMVPKGMSPGSDVANLSVLGYDPKKYYTGRAPLEAASIGVELGPDDVAYRCNLVTIRMHERSSDGRAVCRKCYMEDFSAGHISTAEAGRLIGALNTELGSSEISFHKGVSYRHLMVWKNGEDRLECVPPHDITGREVMDKMPVGEGADVVVRLMRSSIDVLENHEVNQARVAAGKLPANCIWLWGQGKRPRLPKFKERYGLNGAMISAVDLMKGIGRLLGFRLIDVPGATGYIDTNYKGKAEAALAALADSDIVYVHVEAPDEAGHGGKLDHKITAIEDFDQKVVGTVMEGLKGRTDCRVLVLPDHPTPISVKSHTSDPVPFVLWEPGRERAGDASLCYDEECASKSSLVFEDGYKLMDYLIDGGKAS